jgi:DNA polymerase I-like protein with 3'-5' exonuclease and polymerase domains
MSQIISGKNVGHSLEEVVKRELGINLDKSMQDSKNWVGKLTQRHFDYSKRDAEVTYDVTKALLKKIMNNGQMPELIRDQEALPFTIRCKIDGIYFDKEGWIKALEAYTKVRDDLEVSVLSELGTKINLNSPIQLKQVLANRGIGLSDTKDETLASLEDVDPVVKHIRQYRAAQKLVTSTSDTLLKCVNRDGRIRADWKIHGAVTGRMSCSSPNIQQMDKYIKPFFKAEAGNILIDCDYSQIELRVVAQISGDKEMLEAFHMREDLHLKTARMIFGKAEIGKSERQIAKTCNFGLIYGMSATGLKKRLKETCDMDVSIREAEQFRERFFRLYKGVKKWQQKSLNKSVIATLGGRKWKSSELSFQEKYNYPVQGTAAEGLKEAMDFVTKEIPDHWKICAVIHDEILLEVPIVEETIAKDKLEQWMVQGMSRILCDVPIVAEASSSLIWEKA